LSRRSFGPLLILLLAWLRPAAADDFGVTFQPPPGWKPVEVQGSRSFVPPDQPPGTFMLLIVSHADTLAAQTFRAWYEHQLAQVDLQVVERGEIVDASGHGQQILVTTETAQDSQTGRFRVLLYGFSADNRAALAVMMTNSDALAQQHMPTVRAFFDSLAFTAEPPPSSPPLPTSPDP
jgi:hypothetical protein